MDQLLLETGAQVGISLVQEGLSNFQAVLDTVGAAGVTRSLVAGALG